MCLEESPWVCGRNPPDPGFCYTVSYIHTVKQPGLASWRQEGSQTHVGWGRQAPGVRLLVWRKGGVQDSHQWSIKQNSLAFHTLLTPKPMNCQSKPNAMPFVMDLLHHPQTPTEVWPPPSSGSPAKIKLVLQYLLETSGMPCPATFD